MSSSVSRLQLSPGRPLPETLLRGPSQQRDGDPVVGVTGNGMCQLDWPQAPTCLAQDGFWVRLGGVSW